MSSISALQRRLDSQFDRAQNQLDDAAMDAAMDASDGYSQADSFAFFEATIGLSNASWAASQELIVKHGLAKAIINEIN
ncbi:type III secretion protein HrpF [Erwinia tracheiphila]|uniref:Serine kinase n=1 Tax=Erwinia tracheiphila TaxID=65700 RepID=A0A0M2KAW2_9GAMM|nr:type III secretion system protein [Erwinia tracheiphila]AXF77201.1 serine kinase [Erwinia tracheiphila]EOS94907.1 type III secretion system protein [Erwinia tracheiphila PSU-1]KKF36069.1 serine kinase [Erwinia tracheiphila]UIA84107.1 type III secretion protein HrpF [Erwinia tracheiphila]UIA87389.1 type III secretion protein HrpF [Erwinia tracheiphila]